ncbi:carcinoembryonic antigen-related cell adhesion molecule 1 [Osmerus eperlanus]|uniref:carcinoembryonic antigen-related cell adhesion molecule 1 n=1 Tax=Osmerus eperlanus TaxID=29151 RepID=UPI002E0D16CE
MDFLNFMVFLLSVAGCCFGQKALPPGPVEGVIGKNVTFTTFVSPGDYLTVSWTFNAGSGPVAIVTHAPGGRNYGIGYEGKVSLNPSNGVLQLGPLTAKDSGEYTLNMINNMGIATTGETTLKVLEPVSAVTITSSLTEAVEINSTVVLTCTSKGSFLKYAWLNGSAPVAPDTHVTLSADSRNLTVSAVLRTDLAGPIYCAVSNSLEKEKSAPFNLTVHFGPENIAMTINPTGEIVKKGSNLTLTCLAKSSPAAQFKWIHNGVERKETDPTLVLANVDESQAGNITCMAFNAKTMRYLSAQVVKFTVIEAISSTKITSPTDTLVAGNSTASLKCSATTGTMVTRTWMKDGKPLLSSNRVNVSGDSSQVTIIPVQKEDSGEYKCLLTNAVNKEEATHKMVVNYGPEEVKVTGEDAVEITEPVRLNCVANSLPAATFVWRFNGTLTQVTSPDYVMEGAVYKNTGIYTCVATNAITGLTRSAAHLLSVKEEGALDKDLSDGAIAGIIIAVLVLVAAVIAGVVYMRRKQTIESPY